MTASRVRRVPLAGLLVACAAVLVSCGVPTESATNPIRDQDVPYELLEPAVTTSTPRAEGTTTTERVSETIPLYLVRNDRIEKRERKADAPVGTAARLAMLAEPLPDVDTEAGFRSAVPPGSFTSTAPTIQGGVATVDLSREFTAVPGKEQALAFAQITYTLTDLPGVGQVMFTLNGSPISALDADGALITGAVTEDTYRNLYAS